MKLPSVLAVVLVLLLPTSARAQSITLKDITGAWSRGNARNDTLFIRADSTFIMSGKKPPYQLYQHVNYLRGDTTSLSKSDSPAVCRGERMGYCGEPGYKITLKEQQLTLTNLGDTDTYYNGTYTRVSAQPPKEFHR